MLTGKKLIGLVDVDIVHDYDTGDETFKVIRGRKLAANVELVGVNTSQLAQVQGWQLKYSVEVERIVYNDEKYVFFDNKLYSIRTLTKAKSPNHMLLNVQEETDSMLLEVVKQWMQWKNYMI